jgi:hypothetical protein
VKRDIEEAPPIVFNYDTMKYEWADDVKEEDKIRILSLHIFKAFQYKETSRETRAGLYRAYEKMSREDPARYDKEVLSMGVLALKAADDLVIRAAVDWRSAVHPEDDDTDIDW